MKNAGYGLFFVPRATLYHAVSSSIGGEFSPMALAWFTHSRRIFMLKHGRPRGLVRYTPSALYFYATRLAAILIYFVSGRGKLSAAIIKGLFTL